MTDRPPTSTVGRPRARSVHQTLKVTKVGRPRSKSMQKSKAKESAKKNPTKWVVKPILQWDVAVADQEFPTDLLPTLPPIDLEQGNNNNNNNLQLDYPNQPLDLPAGEENQPNEQDFPANQQNPTE